MNNAPTNPEPGTPGTHFVKAPKQSHKARITIIVIVILLSAAALRIAIPWANYRLNNIVLREASLRGVVTKIGARIDGRIKSVDVDPGQRVTKGEVLLRMEDSHLQAALQRARGDLQSATLELENERMSIIQTRRRLTFEMERSKSSIKKASSELDAQKSNLARLEKDYDRTAALVKDGAEAQAKLDKITGDRDKALAYVNSAAAVLEGAQSTSERAVNELEGLQVRENHLGVMEAQIAVARAKVAMAEADIESTVVTAPEDGLVLERIVNVGGSAKVGEQMISLWIGKPWIEAWADERDLCNIHVQNAVDVSFDAAPSQRLAGRVESIGLVTDKQLQPTIVPASLHAFVRQNAMVPIRIALEDENPPVQLGLSVLVGIRKGVSGQSSVARGPSLLPTASGAEPAARSNNGQRTTDNGQPTNAAVSKL